MDRNGRWAKPDGSWVHTVRAKVFGMLLTYMPESVGSPVQQEVVSRVREAEGIADRVRHSFVLTGTARELDRLRALGEVLLGARTRAWSAGDRDAAYFLALYGGRALIHADQAAAEQASTVSSQTVVPSGRTDPGHPTATAPRRHVGKYRALWDWLQRMDGDHLHLTFAEIEQILEMPLPPSSRKHPPHWHSYEGSAVVRAIVDAGWRTRRVSIADEVVTLVREG